MSQPVGIEHFYHDGRGPTLQRVCWFQPGNCAIRAIEYFCPGDVHDAAHLRHVRFVAPQVFMFTPEEVIAYGSSLVTDFGARNPAAAFDLGRSGWLMSFSPRHLSRCHHYQLLFYDELLDIICEGLDFQTGAYPNSVPATGS